MKPSKKTQARLDARVAEYQRVHVDGTPFFGTARQTSHSALRYTRPGSRKKVC